MRAARRVLRAVADVRPTRGASVRDAGTQRPSVEAVCTQGGSSSRGLKSAADSAFPGVRAFTGIVPSLAVQKNDVAFALKASLAAVGTAGTLYALTTRAGCLSHQHANVEATKQHAAATDEPAVALHAETHSSTGDDAAPLSDSDDAQCIEPDPETPSPENPNPAVDSDSSAAFGASSTAVEQPAAPAAEAAAAAPLPSAPVAQSAAETTDAALLGDDGRKLLFQLAAQHWVSLLFTAAFTFLSTLLKLAATRKMGKMCAKQLGLTSPPSANRSRARSLAHARARPAAQVRYGAGGGQRRSAPRGAARPAFRPETAGACAPPSLPAPLSASVALSGDARSHGAPHTCRRAR